jgi:mannose-6-phosphate isomerase-like protein (cupin superfamily)
MAEFKVLEVERPWGNFRQFTHNSISTVKILTILPNEELSLQSHSKRAEFCRVIAGSGIFEIGNVKHDAREGDEYNIAMNVKHRVIAGASGLTYLEISTGDFEENDQIRYEDKYGRV